MARRIDKLQINALNASNSQILVARGGKLAFDDPANVFAGGSGGDAGFANVALRANIANLVLSIGNFTTNNLNEGTANLYFTNARVVSAVDPKLTTSNVTELNNLYFTNTRVTTHVESTIFSNVRAVTVSANSFASTGFGIPTVRSSTNINLSANADNGGAVVIQSSPLRLRSYTNGAIANLTAATGDTIFNSSIGKAQIYDGANWANVGAGAVSGDQTFTGNLLPAESNVYSLGSSNNRWKDLYLSGNTLYLGDVQLSAANSKLRVSAIEANIIVTSNPTLYSAGRGITISTAGVIATSADDSELYDVGIDYQIPYMVTNSMEVATRTPILSSLRYLLYSFVITNISSANAYLDAEILFNNNTFTYANAYTIPYGTSIDLITKPEVLYANTAIKLRASSNNAVSAYLIYKSITDLSYENQFTTIDQSNTYINLYSPISGPAIVESIKLINRSNTDLRGTLLFTNTSDTVKSYIASNTLLSKRYFTETLRNPLRLELGDKIKFSVFNAEANSITAIVGARLGEAYTITPNTTTVSEGGIVRFQINTINVPSFASRNFRTTGNVTTLDFVGGNTGSFTVIDDKANIYLQLAQDGGSVEFEGEETFRLQIVSDTNVVLRTSDDIVIVKDSSNAFLFSSVAPSSTDMYAGTNVTITINTLNALSNPSNLYYSTTGNVDIFGPNTGVVAINSDTTTFDIIPDAIYIPEGETRSFAVQIRENSVTGNIIGTTSNITVNNFVANILSGIDATGGTIIQVEE